MEEHRLPFINYIEKTYHNCSCPDSEKIYILKQLVQIYILKQLDLYFEIVTLLSVICHHCDCLGLMSQSIYVIDCQENYSLQM